jgi:LuxR family maltose regulon positive regulatory protein
VFFASGETPSGSDGTADRGISASRQVLRQLEKYNLFLVPLDDERHWYRYHHLFAHFLRLRLREKQPELIFELHRRASQWFEAEGLVDEAIQHALMTGDSERATRLVDQIAASLVVRRDPNRLLKLVDQLPLNLCQEYPMLCIWRAWALLFAGQLHEVEPVLQIAEAHQAKAPQFPIPGYATTVRAYVANGLGDLTKAIDLTQQALEQMSDASPDRMTLIHQGAAVIWLGVNYRHLGDLDKARRLFVEAAPLNRKAGNIYAALAALEQLGDLAMVQGRLHRAAEIFRRGLRDAKSWPDGPQRGRGTLLAATGLHLGLGTVLYQWNDLAGATHHIQRAVELDELGKAVGRVQSYRMLAYLKQAAGDYEAAYDLLAQACAIRDNLSVRQMNMAAEPSLEQLRILLSRAGPDMSHLLRDAAQRMESLGLDSDLAEATSSLDFASPATYARAAAYTDLARVLITTGRAGEANLLIERLLEAAQSMGRRGDGIRYLVLQALALHTQGDTTTALDSLNQALTLAEPEGYVRLFVDEGEPVAELLQEMASRGVANDYIEKLLAAFPPATQHSIGFAVVKPAVAQPLIEALSARELDVLRLMAARLKYKEISEQLFISLNTVRFHVKNIYGKLAVHNRAQAIDRAKALNLLKARGN